MYCVCLCTLYFSSNIYQSVYLTGMLFTYLSTYGSIDSSAYTHCDKIVLLLKVQFSEQKSFIS